MARLVPLFVCCLVACGFEMSTGSPDAGVGSDAPATDAEVDAPPIDAPDLCIGEGAHEVCFTALPTTPVMYGGVTTLDTSLAATCTPTTNAGASGWCVIAGTTIEVLAAADVRVIGNKPVVFAATGDISVIGTIDVGSRGSSSGAGANFVGCNGGTNATAGNSSGGGFGGSFAGRGGNGEGADGGFGGIAPAIATNVTALRGGCPGGPGGPVNTLLAMGGAGGGALALVSRTKLLISGRLNASGAGGSAGEQPRQGSGGGGSGGMIVLDAPAIDATGANIFANGGGGGEGADLVNEGVFGQEPLSPLLAGIGGSGASAGGDGGEGSLGGNGSGPPMNASASNAGGGGGGGGAGVVLSTVVPLTGGNVSPAPPGTPPT
jgi:hypothetical protein